MRKFYFYGAVTYPTKDINDIPQGSIGYHCVEGDNEEELRNKYENSYENKNSILVDMFGNERKLVFKWLGELKKCK